ncbi:MAG: TIGR03088 family PEP-CTERM/XrtA system glycosyltransferase [Burkholderiales bacterium]
MNTGAPPLVLHVIHNLSIGGLENGLVNLINTMPVSGYRHAIACIEAYSDFRDRIKRPDVEVIALKRSQVGHWRMRRDIFRLCRRLRPDILHSRNMSALDALLPARLAGVTRSVHGEHGWDVDNLDGEHWKPIVLRRLHAPLIDHYITVSDHLKRYLAERIGIAAQRISHVCNGVDTDRFAPDSSSSSEWLPERFKGEDKLLIGSVGRIQAVKDHATLLHAFSMLIETSPALRARLRMTIVGDGPLLTELRAYADLLKIADLVWFPGALDNIPDVLRALDVFVLPSLNEGISNTILEAMAAGIPVLTTAVGGSVELVEEGVSGRFFAPGDAPTLSKMLGDYAENPVVRRAHGEAARRIAVDRFSLTAMVAGYESVYDRLCHRTAR